MTQIVSWWDELQKILAWMKRTHLPNHHQLGERDKKNQVKCVQTNIGQAFIKIKK